MLTNFDTNKVFIAQGLTSLPFCQAATSLVGALEKQHLEWGQLPCTNSPLHIWARDYMPIQLSNDQFLVYKYNPDYLKDSGEK